jgi:hypothetical protein
MARPPDLDVLSDPGAPRALRTRRIAPSLAVFFAAPGAVATSALTTVPAHAGFSKDKTNPTVLSFLAEGIHIIGMDLRARRRGPTRVAGLCPHFGTGNAGTRPVCALSYEGSAANASGSSGCVSNAAASSDLFSCNLGHTFLQPL